MKPRKTLAQRFPPSPACDCGICRGNCQMPGYWTPDECRAALDSGHSSRMMLDVSDDSDYGILMPAIVNQECRIRLVRYTGLGCTFFVGGLCQLHNTAYKPLECRFTHHARMGKGAACHSAIIEAWDTPEARVMVYQWIDDYLIEGDRAKVFTYISQRV